MLISKSELKKVAQTANAMGISNDLPLMAKARMHHTLKVISCLPMIQ